MQTFLQKYKKNKYSQNGEDGIIKEILDRLNIQLLCKDKKPVCAEFGAADGFYLSNTRALIEKGWDSFLYDIDPKGDVKYGKISAANINDLIPPDINLLSIDVDGDDFFIWQGYKGSPQVVIIEINSSIPPDEERPVNVNEIGCSYRQMLKLGISKNYFLVCHTGNLIFVLNEFKYLFPEITGDPLVETDKYFNTSWLEGNQTKNNVVKKIIRKLHLHKIFSRAN